MKFAIGALIVCAFLVAVPAIEVSSVEEDGVPIESYTFYTLTSFYKLCKVALRTLKGFNCTIKAVMNIRAAAIQFPVDIQNCGADVSKQLQNVINSCSSVVKTADNIINAQNTICAPPADASDSTVTSAKCVKNVAKNLYTLNKQIKNTISLIKKVPSIPGDAGVCVQTALNDLTNSFNSLPSDITECSKLTS